jgi:hypothetical protein
MPTLIRHPLSPALGVSSLEADASVDEVGDLALMYRLIGDPRRLRLPSREPPERRDGLWRHTCFELFVGATGEAYREFNFSPAGHWQAYAFGRYRQDGHLPQALAPHIEAEVVGSTLALGVHLLAANLPPGPRLRLGLTAVLEASDGGRAYWALKHASGQPDFHRAESFTLVLDRSGASP